MALKDKKHGEIDKISFFSEIVNKFKAQPLLYIGSVIILLLVLVTFLAGDLLAGGGRAGRDADFIFGYYDKVPITWTPGNTFSQYIEQIERNFRSYNMDTSDFQISFAIWRQAFESMVLHTAILQEVNRSNYSISTDVVDEFVARLPHFQENGRFSASLFRQMPESRRLALWEQVREDLIKNMYFDDITSLLVPSAEARFIANISANMRNFDVVSFQVDDFPVSEYLSYAEANADKFSSIHLSRISVGSSERDAQRIRDTIIDGTNTFEDAARSQSQDGFADRGGDMGLRYAFEVEWEIPSAEDREKIFALRRGELSDIINIGTTWSFFRIEDELKEPDFDDEVVMERVRSYLRDFERGRMENWAIAQAEDFINEAASYGFEDAALSRGLEMQSFGPLPLNFGSVDLFNSLETFTIQPLSSSELSSMSRNDNFWRIAFSTQLNTPSQPFVQGSNVFVLYPKEREDNDEISEDMENRIEDIVSMYSAYWLRYVTEQSLQTYFLNSEKMDNRFFETYMRLFF